MQDGNEGRHEIIHQIPPSDDLISSRASQPTSIVNNLSVFALSFHLGFLLDVAMVGDVREVLRVLLDSEGLRIVSNLSGVSIWTRFLWNFVDSTHLCQLSFRLLEFSVILHVWLELCVFGNSLQLRRFGYCCCLRFGDMSVKSRKELSERKRLQQLQHHSPPPWVRRVDLSHKGMREQNSVHAHCAIFILRLFMMQLKPPSIVNSRWWQAGLCYAFTLNGLDEQRRTFVNTTTRALCPETSRRRHSKCF